MIIKNHKIVFGTPLKIDQSFNLATKNKPFIKAPFYPGWEIKTISGKKFEVINQNNFIAFFF